MIAVADDDPLRLQVEREWGALEAQRVVVCDRNHGLTDDAVTALAADAEGGVWVGTARGLSRLHEGAWTCPAGRRRGGASAPSGTPFRRSAFDQRGRLWAGDAEGALGARERDLAAARGGRRPRRRRGDRAAGRRAPAVSGSGRSAGSAAGEGDVLGRPSAPGRGS